MVCAYCLEQNCESEACEQMADHAYARANGWDEATQAKIKTWGMDRLDYAHKED